jgi:DNA polymerase-1
MFELNTSIPNAIMERDLHFKVLIPEDIKDLPISFIGAKKVFLDFETTSGADDKTSLSPWRDCKILGICITVDNFPNALYIPIRHRNEGGFYNLNPSAVFKWLKAVLDHCDEWVNHNIKYDAHALYNDAGIKSTCKMVDTLVLAKLYDSNRFRYDLDISLREDLSYDIGSFEFEMKRFLGGSKDYGVVPIDKMAKYGAVDAIGVRLLYNFYTENIPAECNRVKELEVSLTPILFEMENVGMMLNVDKVTNDMLLLPQFLGGLKREIMAELNAEDFKPNKNEDCHALICGTMGLPVIEWTEKTKKPSFSAKALEGYRNMTIDKFKVIHYLMTWKRYYKLYTSFTKSFHTKVLDDGRLHSNYNQIVQTGRMSSRDPNAQQLSPLAKEYIIAPEGYAILDVDFSQIEFRVIVHYANDTRCIKAYNEDPNTDFHNWVQTMCKLTRSQAKTLNFRLGYGGGKKSTALALTTTEGFIGHNEEIDDAIVRGEDIYDNYYKQLPTLKRTRWRASTTLKERGYTRTLMGRHRHLPDKAAFKAFNSACQGTAADFMKDATIRLWDYLKASPHLQLFGIVHDSWCIYVPVELVEEVATEVIKVVEEIPEGINFRVPIKADYKVSNTNWSLCK